MGKWQKVVWVYHNLFNLRLGISAIVIVGGMVALENWQDGIEEMLWAGAVAGFTGFFTTGAQSRVVQHFAVLKNRPIAYLLGSGLPTLGTLIFHLGGQLANQTPELFLSVLSPTLLTLTSSTGLNFGTYYYINHPPSGIIKTHERFLRAVFHVPA